VLLELLVVLMHAERRVERDRQQEQSGCRNSLSQFSNRASPK
jgi:hypothetical protein